MIPRVFSRRKGAPRPPDGEPFVYVGRPSLWGNPFPRQSEGGDAVSLHEAWVLANPPLMEDIRRELRGKHLVCWCAPGRCHADILLKIANAP